MSFLLACPNCGERSVYEFRSGGELRQRPPLSVSSHEWARYLYLRKNEAGQTTEWWYHQLGCRRWFLAVRNTCTNRVTETYEHD